MADPRIVGLLKLAGDLRKEVAIPAQRELAKAMEVPLRKGVLRGDIIGTIFEAVTFEPGAAIEFPLDFLAPSTEKDYVAYTIPNHGRIPEQHVEGDFLMVPTYDTGSSVDFLLKYLRDARWDVTERAMEVLEGTHIRKDNADGWHTILASATGRNLVVYDANASIGFFSKRLVALAKTVMRRNAGGNSTSLNMGMLTDLYLSPEGLEDIRLWDLTQVDDFTRREIIVAPTDRTGEMSITRIFNVDLHDIDELGVGQEFQLYWTNVLNGVLPSGKQEVAVGLDLQRNDSFMHPIRSELEIYEDENLHRQRRAGFYSWKEGGWAALDSRRSLLLSF